MNNLDQVFLELYQKVSDGHLLFWPSVFIPWSPGGGGTRGVRHTGVCRSNGSLF